MKQIVLCKDLGENCSYKEIWDLQESMLQENVRLKSEKIEDRRQKSEDSSRKIYQLTTHNSQLTAHNLQLTTYIHPSTQNHLLFAEHKPVYTLGKSGDISNVLINDEEREQKGIEFFKINRGGDITFHGPGQLVGYPILDLDHFKTDLGWYLRNLEEVIILTMADYGLKGDRSKGETGVWIDPDSKGRERKICAMGIRCSRWITMHGFAFNVNTDLDYFNYIIPCGIKNKPVTSLQKELGNKIPMPEVKKKVWKNFEKVFDAEVVEI